MMLQEGNGRGGQLHAALPHDIENGNMHLKLQNEFHDWLIDLGVSPLSVAICKYFIGSKRADNRPLSQPTCGMWLQSVSQSGSR